MTYTVSITSQGQISIPAPLRRKLGLDKNRKAVISEKENRLIIDPVVDLLELKGAFKTNNKIPFNKIRAGFEKYLAEEAVKGMK